MGLRLQDPDLKVANVVVFEDAPSGVAAAHAAGM
jgi:HAD superfamily hydrolase (TIGR01509 family)